MSPLKLKYALGFMLIVIAFGIVGEMDYQDEVKTDVHKSFIRDKGASQAGR